MSKLQHRGPVPILQSRPAGAEAQQTLFQVAQLANVAKQCHMARLDWQAIPERLPEIVLSAPAENRLGEVVWLFAIYADGAWTLTVNGKPHVVKVDAHYVGFALHVAEADWMDSDG